SMNRCTWRGEVLSVARRPVADERTSQMVDVIVCDLAAAVETLVNDDGFLVHLGEKVSLEKGVARLGGVGNIDVRDSATGRLMDFPEVPFRPGKIAQPVLAL